ncbi:MAG: flavin-dependent dehydrogenase [Crocinitomicaceae bacterium]|jgi:flavin-dependent dehydrogenase
MEKHNFDLIILGGGISGSLMGISLIAKNPEMRVAIVERNSEFPQKIGESTSDITTLFFRNLGIDHILKSHSQKAGLLFLFNEKRLQSPEHIGEFASPTLKSSIPGYHLNRKEFDEALLLEAEKRGCTVYRPAAVVKSELKPFSYDFEIEFNGENVKIHSNKMLDSTGRVRFLKNQLNWKDLELDLNTSAISAHFKGVDTSSIGSKQTKEYWKDVAIGDISYSTTHFMRNHSWWWMIRVDETTHSIGFVFDNDKFNVEDAESFYEEQLQNDPELSILTKNANLSNHQYWPDVAYCSERLYEDGASVIGDSGAFSDPFISPGMELICQQVLWLTDLYDKDFTHQKFNNKAWKKYERAFLDSYKTRNELYKHWYGIMEHYDLLSSWLRLSLFIYFGFHTNPSLVFKKRLKQPLRIKGPAKLGYLFIKSRMNSIAKKRRDKDFKIEQKKDRFSYSGVKIVGGVQLITLPVILLSRWIRSYILIEYRNFKS